MKPKVKFNIEYSYLRSRTTKRSSEENKQIFFNIREEKTKEEVEEKSKKRDPCHITLEEIKAKTSEIGNIYSQENNQEIISKKRTQIFIFNQKSSKGKKRTPERKASPTKPENIQRKKGRTHTNV